MLDPAAIKDYLERPIRPWPEWKKLSWEECQQLIIARTGIPFKRTKGPRLYAHQLRTLTACIMYDHSLVWLGMRTGKTRVFMEYAEHMRKANMWKGQGLVITPGPTVVREAWGEQAPAYSDLKYQMLTSTKLDDFIDATESDADILVIGWPSLIRMFGDKRTVKKRGKDPANMYVLDKEAMGVFGAHFTLGAIDELHLCANPTTARYHIGKALLGGPTVKLSMGLTGTAFGRADPFQVWAQANIINERLFGNNFHFFKAAYGKKVRNPFAWGGFEIKFDKTKTKNFQDRLASSSIAYKLSEVRVSDVRDDPVTLEMKGEQLSEYRRTLDGAIEQARKKELSATARENLYVKLRRISAGIVPFRDTEGRESFVTLPNHAKQRWLDEAFEAGMFESRGILFHEYTETGKSITAWLKKKKIKFSWLYGGTKANERPVQDFMRGKAHWIVCNIASGAVGWDGSKADYVIFYEGSSSPTLRAQAEARPLGPGRGKRPLFVLDLLASAVDKRVLDLAKKGIRTHDSIIYSDSVALGRLLR